jgi:hypothetical protein
LEGLHVVDNILGNLVATLFARQRQSNTPRRNRQPESKSVLSFIPTLYKTLPYDAVRDFTPIGLRSINGARPYANPAQPPR